MGISAFVKNHPEEQKEELFRFLKTVFHSTEGVDTPDEKLFFTRHSESPSASSPWPYSSLEKVLDGSANNTYHFCTCSVRPDAEGGKISRRRERFNALHVIVLDDIGTKVEPNGVPPSYIIETSAGNYQYGYVLNEPIRDRQLAQRLISAVYNKTGLTDSGGAMINKLVKLPLGRNLKEGRGNFSVRLVELNDKRYSVTQLINEWQLNLDAKTISKIRKAGGDIPLVDPLLEWLQDNDMLHGRESDGYYRVECPEGDAHSNSEPYAGYSPLGEGENPKKRHFKCFHEHKESGGPPDTLMFLTYCTVAGGPKVGIDAPSEHFENDDGFHPMGEGIPPEHFPDVKVRSDGLSVIKKTHSNVEYLLDRYGYTAHYDVISKKAVIEHYEVDEMDADNYENAMIYSIVSQCAQCDLNIGIDMLSGYLMQITLNRPRNPVTEFLDELEPDFCDSKFLGVAADAHMLTSDAPFDPENFNAEEIDFVKLLASTVTLASMSEQDMFEMFLRLWLIQCVAAADSAVRTPNHIAKPKYEAVLTYVGRQGAQKTKWWNALVPKELRNYFMDGALLNPADKDSCINVNSNWIVELGEIDATFKRSEIAQLKAYLSQGKDRLRPPYARQVAEFKRRTSFCASVNDTQFLHDSTGNRRFWPVHVESLAMPSRELMLCVWWQVWREYLTGEKWWIDDIHTMNQVAVATEQFDSVHETPEIACLVSTFGVLCYDTMALDGCSEWYTCKEICDMSGITNINRYTMRTISSYILNRVPRGLQDRVKKKGRSNQILYRMPIPKNKFS